jgi:hypothetical protein
MKRGRKKFKFPQRKFRIKLFAVDRSNRVTKGRSTEGNLYVRFNSSFFFSMISLRLIGNSARRSYSYQKVLHYDAINPNVKTMEYAVHGPIVVRAGEINKELAKVCLS